MVRRSPDITQCDNFSKGMNWKQRVQWLIIFIWKQKSELKFPVNVLKHTWNLLFSIVQFWPYCRCKNIFREELCGKNYRFQKNFRSRTGKTLKTLHCNPVMTALFEPGNDAPSFWFCDLNASLGTEWAQNELGKNLTISCIFAINQWWLL